MNAVAEETTVHAEAETQAKGTCSCGIHTPDMAKMTDDMTKRFERGFKDAKFAVTDKLEDTRHEAERFVKRGRYAFEDAMTVSPPSIPPALTNLELGRVYYQLGYKDRAREALNKVTTVDKGGEYAAAATELLVRLK